MKFLLDLLYLILFAGSAISFILLLGVYIVPEKKKFVPIWLRAGIFLLFLIPVCIQIYFIYFIGIPLYNEPFHRPFAISSALTSSMANAYPYNIINFTAISLNIVLGYILHRLLWKHRNRS